MSPIGNTDGSKQAKSDGGFAVKDTRLGKVPLVTGYLPFAHMAEEILTPGPGRVRALTMASGNPVLAGPGGARLEEALANLELFVSFDLYQNESNRFAHYILPCTTFLEREDLPTLIFQHSIRPFAQYTDAVIPPVGEARPEHTIFNDIDARLHRLFNDDTKPPPTPLDPIAIVDSMLHAGPLGKDVGDGSGGLTVARLKSNVHGLVLSLNLKCDNWQEKIRHEDGRIHLWHEMLEEEFARLRAMAPPRSGELRLFSRRDIRSINSWMHNVERLSRGQHPALLMNPSDAMTRNIIDDQMVRITTSHGSIEVVAKVTNDVMAGSVCYPHGWGHQGSWKRANNKPSANINILAGSWDGEKLSGSILLDGIIVAVEAA
jgi:formate dehydrogenase